MMRSRSFPPGFILIGIGIGFVVLAIFGAGGFLIGKRVYAGISASEYLSIGSPAPEFSLVTINGEQIHLSELRGTPVVINFWATWCGPCVSEMPLLQQRYEEHQQDFELLAINADEPISDVTEFVQDYQLTFPILLDPDGNVQRLFRITAYPTSFFIDREGKIRAIHLGAISETQLDRYLTDIEVGE